MTRVWRVTVTCERCKSNVVDFDDQPRDHETGALVVVDGRVPEDAPSDWRLFAGSAWGHGSVSGGMAEWYDVPTDPTIRRTRSHVDAVTGDVVLICAHRFDATSTCANQAEFSREKWEAIVTCVAGAGQDRVSIEGMRRIAAELANRSTRRSHRGR